MCNGRRVEKRIEAQQADNKLWHRVGAHSRKLSSGEVTIATLVLNGIVEVDLLNHRNKGDSPYSSREACFTY